MIDSAPHFLRAISSSESNDSCERQRCLLAVPVTDKEIAAIQTELLHFIDPVFQVNRSRTTSMIVSLL